MASYYPQSKHQNFSIPMAEGYTVLCNHLVCANSYWIFLAISTISWYQYVNAVGLLSRLIGCIEAYMLRIICRSYIASSFILVASIATDQKTWKKHIWKMHQIVSMCFRSKSHNNRNQIILFIIWWQKLEWRCAFMFPLSSSISFDNFGSNTCMHCRMTNKGQQGRIGLLCQYKEC